MSSRILEDLNQLVAACYPKSQEEALDLWHNIKPVRFGDRVEWTDALEYTLAFYDIPDDNPYLVVLRVNHYIGTTVPAAAGFGLKGPPVFEIDLFSTRWVSAPTLPAAITADFNVTGGNSAFQLLDTDEMLFFKGGSEIALLCNLPANPTADERFLFTLVYGYLLGPTVADKLGSGETLILTT